MPTVQTAPTQMRAAAIADIRSLLVSLGRADQRCNPLDALDHAGGDRGQEEFRRIERVRTASDVGVHDKAGILGVREAAMRVNALGRTR